MNRLLSFSLLALLLAILLYLLLNLNIYADPKATFHPGQIWGASDINSTAVVPFHVSVPDETLADLKSRLANWRPPSPTLAGVDYSYGMPSQVLARLVDYWRETYDWRKAEAKLNSMPQFRTVVQGLSVHFVHVRGAASATNRVPLLLLHGWPGSVFEFYKAIPLLNSVDSNDGVAFDVVAPSIPGYAFSEVPSKPGFDPVAAAELFRGLMARLGYDKFVVQGGDWGALIGNVLAHMFPQSVIGFHTNFALPPTATVMDVLHLGGAVFLGKEGTSKLSTKKLAWLLLEEGGYLHEQATKPDTVGVALSDSPVGLAGYILEKFASWAEHVEFKTGRGLTNDELLTNVMLYWVTNHATSAMRFYKEAVHSKAYTWTGRSFGDVPTAVACYPRECFCTPRSIVKRNMPVLVQYSDMPRGGHFAAFEEPQLFADDLRSATLAFLRRRAVEQDAADIAKFPTQM